MWELIVGGVLIVISLVVGGVWCFSRLNCTPWCACCTPFTDYLTNNHQLEEDRTVVYNACMKNAMWGAFVAGVLGGQFIILYFVNTDDVGMKWLWIPVGCCAVLFMFLHWAFWGQYGTGDYDESEPKEAQTIYQDMEAPLTKVALFFIGQCLLFVFFMWHIVNMEVVEYDTWRYVYFFSAIPLIFLFLGPEYNLENIWAFWRLKDQFIWYAVYPAGKHHFTLQADVKESNDYSVSGTSFSSLTVTATPVSRGDPTKNYEMNRWSLLLRFMMDIIVNVIFFAVLAVSIPAMLAGSENQLEVVMNSVGLQFLFQLDDLPSGKFYLLLPGGTERPRNCCV